MKDRITSSLREYPIRYLMVIIVFLTTVTCLMSAPVYADVWGDAREIKWETEIKDNLVEIQDKYYTFTLPENGMVTIDFSHFFINRSDIYWRLRIYNRTYDQLVEYEYEGDKVDATSAQLGLTAGKYYITVGSGYVFTDVTYWFTVHYTKADNWEAENNDELQSANPLTLGKAVSGSMMTTGDCDIYSFTPSAPGALTITFAHPKIDFSNIYWRLYLYNGERTRLGEWEIEGNKEKLVIPPIGLGTEKYYFEIYSGNEHSDLTYTLTPVFKASSVWESELNDNRESADPIIVDTMYSGNIMETGDYDYYTFTVSGGGNYTFDFNHSALGYSDSYWRFAVEDSNYTDLISGEDIAGDKTSYSKSLGYLAPGKYWLRIYTGYKWSDLSYSFRIAKEPDAAKTKLSQSISVKNQKKVYGAKTFNLNAKLTIGNGKLKYASSNKKVAAISSKGTVKIKGIGKTIITVSATATNEYKAAVKKITLTVLPKTTTIKALKNTKKNKLTVTWKKNSTVTGYIIQYAANKNFKNAKTVTVKGRAKTSKTVSVKKGKTYYVRIRTYKGNLKSSWSKVMTKKISK